MNGKQATVTGGATTITSSNLTANRALVSNANGKVAASAVTSTELGYLDGVTSAIQTQINGKVPTSRKVNGKALSTNISLTASDVDAVPNTRTINGKALSSDITLSASDIGAQAAGSYATLTDIPAALRGEYGTPLEMGKYIDFHTIDSTADYDARLTCTNRWLSINEHRIVAVASWDGTNLYLT